MKDKGIPKYFNIRSVYIEVMKGNKLGRRLQIIFF